MPLAWSIVAAAWATASAAAAEVTATGFCAVTIVGSSCDEDEAGAWQVRSEDACRQQCSACSGCSFISFSAAYGDCSWFRQCDLQALKQLDPGDDMRMISNTFKTHYIKEPSPRRWPQKPSPTSTSYDYTNEFKQVPGSWAQSVNLRPLLDVHALAGCQTTYLDLGSNIGNWITALFSNRSLNGELNNALGVYGITRQAGEICAWGFEPNPAHYERLHAIERRLHRQSLRRVHFFHAAIASSNGEADFWSDNAAKFHEWGSSLLNYSTGMTNTATARVPTVNLTWLLAMHVGVHSTRRVVMKMDIEGAEFSTLPDAVEIVCRTVDLILIERHDWFFNPSCHKWGTCKKKHALQHQQHLLVAFEAALKRMERLRSESRCATRVLNLATE